MAIANIILVLIVALEHLYILAIEMFGWIKFGGKIVDGGTPEFLQTTKEMAANQGLYNGFLAAGLVWSVLIQDAIWSQNIAIFFLSCVIVAGIYGAISANPKIFLKQGLPATVALICQLII